MFRAILTNTFYQLLAKFIAAGLTFLTTVLILRSAGPSLFGDLTKALSLIAIGYTAIDFGLNADAVRSMRGDLTSQRQVFVDILAARLLLSICAVILLNALIFLLPGGYTPSVKSVFWVGSLAIFFQGIYTTANAWFQRRLTYWKMAAATVAGTLVGAGLTWFALLGSPTLSQLLAASTFGYLVMALVALYFSPRFSLPSLLGAISRVFPTLVRSLTLGLILISSILASKLDMVILGVFRSSAEVGQYGLAYRIFDVLLVLPVFVMNSVYPLLLGTNPASKRTLLKRSSYALVILGVLGALLIYPLAPLIHFIRPGLDLSVLSLRILGLSLPLFFLTSPLMWELIEKRLEKYLLLVYFAAAVFNGFANYLLIPRFGVSAAAFLTLLTELTILGGLTLVKIRFYDQT